MIRTALVIAGFLALAAGLIVVAVSGRRVGEQTESSATAVAGRLDRIESTTAQTAARLARLEAAIAAERANRTLAANATTTTDKEAAQKAAAAERAGREREARKAFELLRPPEQRSVLDLRRRAADSINSLTAEDVRYIGTNLRLFPDLDRDKFVTVLLRLADERGVDGHIRNLGITNPDQIRRLKIAFALADDDTITSAKALAPLFRDGRANRVGEGTMAFIRDHPELFPRP